MHESCHTHESVMAHKWIRHIKLEERSLREDEVYRSGDGVRERCVYISKKERYISAKEPYIPTKETNISANEVYRSGDGVRKRCVYISKKEHHTSAKEPYIPTTETNISAKEPYTAEKSPILPKSPIRAVRWIHIPTKEWGEYIYPRKSPTYPQKSLTYPPKKPIHMQMSPIYPQKRRTFLPTSPIYGACKSKWCSSDQVCEVWHNIYTRKRARHICKRDVYFCQSALYVGCDLQGTESASCVHITAKEPDISAKKTYISAKVPYDGMWCSGDRVCEVCIHTCKRARNTHKRDIQFCRNAECIHICRVCISPPIQMFRVCVYTRKRALYIRKRNTYFCQSAECMHVCRVYVSPPIQRFRVFILYKHARLIICL